MVFDNNETFEVRKRNKRLGQIKFHINAKTSNGLNDSEIIRKSVIVKVKGKIVAQTSDDGNTEYKDDADRLDFMRNALVMDEMPAG